MRKALAKSYCNIKEKVENSGRIVMKSCFLCAEAIIVAHCPGQKASHDKESSRTWPQEDFRNLSLHHYKTGFKYRK